MTNWKGIVSPITCPKCGKKFLTMRELDNHIKVKHNV